MSSDSVGALSPADETMRMPPSAASDVPMAQLERATSAVRAPLSRASDRSSTDGAHGHADARAVEQEAQPDGHRDGHARW